MKCLKRNESQTSDIVSTGCVPQAAETPVEPNASFFILAEIFQYGIRMGTHHGSLTYKRSSVSNPLWVRVWTWTTTGVSHCVPSILKTHTQRHIQDSKGRHCAAVASHTHIQTHVMSLAITATMQQSIVPIWLALRHNLNTYYVDFTSSDIQLHTGLLLKLTDQIYTRLPNIRKQSQSKPLLIVSVTVSITHKSGSQDQQSFVIWAKPFGDWRFTSQRHDWICF